MMEPKIWFCIPVYPYLMWEELRKKTRNKKGGYKSQTSLWFIVKTTAEFWFPFAFRGSACSQPIINVKLNQNITEREREGKSFAVACL